jgi:hypothetical protein
MSNRISLLEALEAAKEAIDEIAAASPFDNLMKAVQDVVGETVDNTKLELDDLKKAHDLDVESMEADKELADLDKPEPEEDEGGVNLDKPLSEDSDELGGLEEDDDIPNIGDEESEDGATVDSTYALYIELINLCSKDNIDLDAVTEILEQLEESVVELEAKEDASSEPEVVKDELEETPEIDSEDPLNIWGEATELSFEEFVDALRGVCDKVADLLAGDDEEDESQDNSDETDSLDNDTEDDNW